jgi:hypothetical protein
MWNVWKHQNAVLFHEQRPSLPLFCKGVGKTHGSGVRGCLAIMQWPQRHGCTVCMMILSDVLSPQKPFAFPRVKISVASFGSFDI